MLSLIASPRVAAQLHRIPNPHRKNVREKRKAATVARSASSQRRYILPLIPALLSLSDRSFAKPPPPANANASANADANAARKLARLAQREADPEVALEIWDQSVGAYGSSSAVVRAGRGKTLLLLQRWNEAIDDFTAALDILSRDGPDKSTLESQEIQLLDGHFITWMVLERAVLLDGIGLAKMQLGDMRTAEQSFRKSLDVIYADRASTAGVPDDTPYNGLLGGAASIGQRVELHLALCLFEQDLQPDAVSLLKRIDKGPNPNGYPQFWDARAALAATLWASGKRDDAEVEWAFLCQPHPPPPPAVPVNPIFARVNKAAQLMIKVEGTLTDKNCEDYDTGTYLPCDDAGIPGLGGANEPCVLYTPEGARARLWPERAVEALDSLRRRAGGGARQRG